jgi:predicted  nucleic acid-binding Zn-ribbon protein
MSIILGLLIVIGSILLIRKEFKKSLDLRVSKLGDFSDVEKRKIIEVIEDLEEEINNLNNAFYDIVNDLEGKYSIHEKQIELLEEKLESIEKNHDSSVSKKEMKILRKEIYEEKELLEDTSIRSQAIKMRSENMSIREIAKTLNIGVGELKLLLNINKNSN